MGPEMTDLGAFLGERLAWPRKAGEWDCCTLPAAWGLALGLGDAMAAWRGVYSTEAEAVDIVARAGGLAGIFGAGLESVGAYRVDEARAGDVGVIALRDEEAGAVYTGRRWAFVAERGLGFVTLRPADVPNIWRFPVRG